MLGVELKEMLKQNTGHPGRGSSRGMVGDHNETTPHRRLSHFLFSLGFDSDQCVMRRNCGSDSRKTFACVNLQPATNDHHKTKKTRENRNHNHAAQASLSALLNERASNVSI